MKFLPSLVEGLHTISDWTIFFGFLPTLLCDFSNEPAAPFLALLPVAIMCRTFPPGG